MTGNSELSISLSLEQLALALGEAGAVPRGDLIRALERAAERLRMGTAHAEKPTDLVSQAEAARSVGVSRQAVNQWVRKGVLSPYPATEGNGRRAPLVSLAEISVAANRWRAEPVSTGFRPQLASFLELLRETPELAETAEAISAAIEEGPGPRHDEDAARVLREFLVAAMGTEGRQQEFTRAGVQMLAGLRPAVAVDTDHGFGHLLDGMELLIRSSDGSAGFDTASAAILGLLGAATVGARIQREESRYGEQIARCAEEVWGEDWVRRLFDAAFHADELVSPAVTRYTAPLVYLGCNRFMRQAQADGVSITYAASPGAVLPQSYHGGPVLSELLAGHRHAVPPWQFEKGSEAVRSALHRSAKSPFRIFNFEYGLFDDSIHGIRRYCFSMDRARYELSNFVEQLARKERTSYLELAVETLARVLERPYVEVATVEPPNVFDWWKDHLIRCSPRETLIGLRGERARKVAHGLLVRATFLPQVLDSGDQDPELRERLRVYVKNLNYDITDERYRDDLTRGTTRLIKSATEDLSRDAALARAEAEVTAMMKPPA
ncbi:hypothetical protein [Amycolatopsis alkalitolerans]|uniref:Helix-turn-helix domain-containing protein n=1 Tax=Amycolatopsis alkalitolerans TaxID=2547244 RepID=A0A5C4M9F6_9PSEU|nr:hypothetical protein [Amycolatopsis alkalitolerans]TNC29218.1 hypothetical protein FG385_03850 [Amycolatopsis alkalitolerans]